MSFENHFSNLKNSVGNWALNSTFKGFERITGTLALCFQHFSSTRAHSTNTVSASVKWQCLHPEEQKISQSEDATLH